jgi:diacylglycerol kinase
MANSRLLTKTLADFLFGFYLLNSGLENATNHTQQRYAQLKKNAKSDT